ncbi:GH11461 [Drosophila grimshawi]|uniref:GH11461 n=1 Tax=Drosophila grimshawi TaxID=7222 RepID=B4JAP0_DROGR|nr:GH11461 [Drosophila grimshawi]
MLNIVAILSIYHSVAEQLLSLQSHSLIEIAPSEWSILRDLYAHKRFESTGYALIDNYIKWKAKEPELDIQCLSLDGDWQSDGTFLMIITNDNQRKTVFFNTLSDDLERLTNALLCLASKSGVYVLHDYGERLVPAVDAYIRNVVNAKMETTQTAWPPVGIELRSVDPKDAATINENWPHGSPDSLKFVKRLIDYNVSVGAYDEQGKLIAWCLRLPIGALGLLQVVETHKRLGLGSLMVRYLSRKISDLGDEVLAPVVTENTASRKLFEKLGFQKIDNVYWTEQLA